MRKFACLLTILVLIGPIMGLVCDCCPMKADVTKTSPILKAEPCGCCPEAVSGIEKEARLTQEGNLNGFLSRSFLHLSTVAFLSLEGFGPANLAFSQTDSGPPTSTPERPLYLSFRNLRL